MQSKSDRRFPRTAMLVLAFALVRPTAGATEEGLTCTDFWTIAGFALEQHRVDYANTAQVKRLYTAAKRRALQSVGAAEVLSKKELETLVGSTDTSEEAKQCVRFEDMRGRLEAAGATVDLEALLSGALDGWLLAMDPHSEYFDRQEYKKYKDGMEGKAVSIGITKAETHERGIIVQATQSGTSAAELLRIGDIVFRADGKELRGMGVAEIKRLLENGNEGSKVVLTVRRDNRTLEVALTREAVEVDYISTHRIPGMEEICYLQLKKFALKTSNRFRRAFQAMNETRSCKALIVDLTYNGGGRGSEEVGIAGQLVKGPFAGHVSYRNELSHMPFDQAEPITEVPVVVMVNGFSASASEMFAATMHDYQRALLVGNTTFGKGTGQTPYTPEMLQEILHIEVPGMVKITRQYFHGPAGDTPQGKGVAPHLVYRSVEEERRRQERIAKAKAAGVKPVLAEKDYEGALPPNSITVEGFSAKNDLSKVIEHLGKGGSDNDWGFGEDGGVDRQFAKKFPEVANAATIARGYARLCPTYTTCSFDNNWW